jgi:hypothetical protein
MLSRYLHGTTEENYDNPVTLAGGRDSNGITPGANQMQPDSLKDTE